MKLAERRERKAALISEINDTYAQICAARNASRVPQRVINGDAPTAHAWKQAMEKAHSHRPPPSDMKKSLKRMEAMTTAEKAFLASLI